MLDAHCPRCEIFQQFLRVVCPLVLIVNTEIKSMSLKLSRPIFFFCFSFVSGVFQKSVSFSAAFFNCNRFFPITGRYFNFNSFFIYLFIFQYGFTFCFVIFLFILLLFTYLSIYLLVINIFTYLYMC